MLLGVAFPLREIGPRVHEHEIQPGPGRGFMVITAIAHEQSRLPDIARRQLAGEDLILVIRAAENAAVEQVQYTALGENGPQLLLIATRNHQPVAAGCLFAQRWQAWRDFARREPLTHFSAKVGQQKVYILAAGRPLKNIGEEVFEFDKAGDAAELDVVIWKVTGFTVILARNGAC